MSNTNRRVQPAALREYLQRRKQEDPQTKVALVLSGSAAPGAYEAGVVDVLLSANVPVDVIVGTSGGALNGCLYLLDRMAGLEAESLAAQVWKGITMGQVLAPAWVLRAWQRVNSFPLPRGVRYAAAVLLLPLWLLLVPFILFHVKRTGALFSNESLQHLMVQVLGRSLGVPFPLMAASTGRQFCLRWQTESLAPELIITATDLTGLQDTLFVLAERDTVEALEREEWTVVRLNTRPGFPADQPSWLVPALFASAAMFPVMPAQRVGDNWHIDGGYAHVTPIHAAIDAGVTHILVVEVEPLANTAPFRGGGFWAVVMRAIFTLVKLNLRDDFESAQRGNRKGKRPVQLYRLYPEANRIGILDFDGRYDRGRVVYPLARLFEDGQRDAEAGFRQVTD